MVGRFTKDDTFLNDLLRHKMYLNLNLNVRGRRIDCETLHLNDAVSKTK